MGIVNLKVEVVVVTGTKWLRGQVIYLNKVKKVNKQESSTVKDVVSLLSSHFESFQ